MPKAYKASWQDYSCEKLFYVRSLYERAPEGKTRAISEIGSPCYVTNENHVIQLVRFEEKDVLWDTKTLPFWL